MVRFDDNTSHVNETPIAFYNNTEIVNHSRTVILCKERVGLHDNLTIIIHYAYPTTL